MKVLECAGCAAYVSFFLFKTLFSELNAVLFSDFINSRNGGVATQKKPKTTANFKFGTGFFRVFFSVSPFWPILTGLTGS